MQDKSIGFWGYPQTFYNTAFGHPVIAAKVYGYPNGPTWVGTVPDRDADYTTEDHYSVTDIWVDKSQVLIAGDAELSYGKEVVRLWRLKPNN